MVQIFKQSNNGEVGVLTDCRDARTYMDELAEAVAKYMYDRDMDDTYSDQARDLSWLLPNAYSILMQYADQSEVVFKHTAVKERRLLFAGDSMPDFILSDGPDASEGKPVVTLQEGSSL